MFAAGELAGVAEPEAVAQDVGAGIDVRVVGHRRGRAAAGVRPPSGPAASSGWPAAARCAGCLELAVVSSPRAHCSAEREHLGAGLGVLEAHGARASVASAWSAIGHRTHFRPLARRCRRVRPGGRPGRRSSAIGPSRPSSKTSSRSRRSSTARQRVSPLAGSAWCSARWPQTHRALGHGWILLLLLGQAGDEEELAVDDRAPRAGRGGPRQHLAEAELALLGGLDALGGRHRPHAPDAVGVDAQARHARDRALAARWLTCGCGSGS